MISLAFSTLGCPTWDMDQILRAAQEYGYTSLEWRGYLNELFLPRAEPFTPAHRAATRQRIADAGLSICSVDASAKVASPEDRGEVSAYAELARELDCPYIRVFGGNLPADMPRADAIARAAETLRSFGDAAQAEGVAVILETHDAFSTGVSVAELLAATAHPAVFSLWDLHHPYRQGESGEATYRSLAPTLRHVHIKDGKAGTYTLLGEGDVPVFPMLDLLLDGGYDGAISLEWEKRWHPQIPEPEVAFPQYARLLRQYLAQHSSSGA